MEERCADWILQEEPPQTKLPFSFSACPLPSQTFFPKCLLSTSQAAGTVLGTQDPLAIIYLEVVYQAK